MSVSSVLHNDIDDIFAVLENGFERRRQDQIKRDNELKNKRDKEVNGAFGMIERALERSIKEEDWRIEKEKKAVIAAEEYRRKIKTAIVSVLIGAALISPFAFTAGKAIINKFEHWKAVNSAVALQSNDAMEELLKYKLAYIDENKLSNLEHATSETPFTVRNNTVSDYQVLNVDDYVDVYLYKINLPSTEFNDFIRSLTYTDNNGDLVHYISFEQYLKINGFSDEETFINYAKEGAYKREVQRNQTKFISVDNESTGKGGRN